MKPLQKTGCLDVQLALLPPIGWLLNDNTYRRVITRNGPVPQILKDMGVAVKISRLSHRKVNQNAHQSLRSQGLWSPSQCNQVEQSREHAEKRE